MDLQAWVPAQALMDHGLQHSPTRTPVGSSINWEGQRTWQGVAETASRCTELPAQLHDAPRAHLHPGLPQPCPLAPWATRVHGAQVGGIFQRRSQQDIHPSSLLIMDMDTTPGRGQGSAPHLESVRASDYSGRDSETCPVLSGCSAVHTEVRQPGPTPQGSHRQPALSTRLGMEQAFEDSLLLSQMRIQDAAVPATPRSHRRLVSKMNATIVSHHLSRGGLLGSHIQSERNPRKL